jgi:hypothetical protein
MSQPKSLLERRLKTMSENTNKPGLAQALLLGALAVGALVAACDAPVPTEVRDAIVEAMGEEGVEGMDAASDNPTEIRVSGAFAEGMPLIYVDGVRVNGIDDLDGLSLIPSLDPDAIDRIEIIKGAAAMRLYGEEAANGVIQIFMKTEEADAEGAGGTPSIRIQGEAMFQSEIKVVPSTRANN